MKKDKVVTLKITLPELLLLRELTSAARVPDGDWNRNRSPADEVRIEGLARRLNQTPMLRVK